ncbi:uncharacterized protein LOC126264622 [Aethina tumida]|uniref:uncharacterized protein LOC126264622 n=1 Tax=Aethina tumida TaxID=116153 RepID=UPI002148CE0C|nr:uncharacterized protein LOC126264622 [Aethina tumida]
MRTTHFPNQFDRHSFHFKMSGEIYDMSNRYYSNNEIKENCWKDISEEINLTEKSQITSLEESFNQSAEQEINIETDDESQSDLSSSPSTPSTSESINSKPRPQTRKSVFDVLQNYLDNKKNDREETPKDSLRSFFMSMADATENLPPHLQIEVKSKVFKAVIDAEVAALSAKQIQE